MDIFDTDSYKFSHFLGYPEHSEYVYSYAESRGGKYPATVFLGLQNYIQDLAETRITREMIKEAEEFAVGHGVPFNKVGWNVIEQVHDGKIPVHIKAVPEGTLVPTRNVLVTVENTDPTLPWLTSYLETSLLRDVWYPTTVATRIYYMKQAIKTYFEKSSDTYDNLGFALLDFSLRGCSSKETAIRGGLGHLVHFIGSDNIPAIKDAMRVYNAPMAAFSVPATEHSIMCAYGEENEFNSFEYLIDNMMSENGILSVVSDTWNVYRAADYFVQLAERIKEINGTLVFRPDSGDMNEVIPKVLKILEEGFGYTLNSKGYKVLNNVKMLWGDGINEDTVKIPFELANSVGISADSIMTGSGGGLMQSNIDRDTCKFAFKASNITINGIDYPIAKNPITDPGKMSKRGRLKLAKDMADQFYTINSNVTSFFKAEDELRTVYKGGEIKNIQTLEEIRARIV